MGDFKSANVSIAKKAEIKKSKAQKKSIRDRRGPNWGSIRVIR